MIETMIKMWDRYGFVYLQGLTGTLCLAAITVFFGTLIGMILAIMRLSRVKPFQWFVRFYIWAVSYTHLLIYFVNYFQPDFSLSQPGRAYYFELLAPLYNAMVWRPPVK